MGNPIDKYRQNATLEGGGAGSGYKSEGYKVPRTKSRNPDDEALDTLALGFGLPLAATAGLAISGRNSDSKDMANYEKRTREAADEIKRETRGVQKNSTDRARDDAREMKMQQQNEKASDAASKDMGFAKGGMTASSRADGCCVKGKTRGKMY
jgi:hypothetical protein